MKRRILIIILIWPIADFYFYQAVKTVTANPFLLRAYWFTDLLIAAAILLITFGRRARQRPSLVSWFMALMLMVLVPKIIGTPLLILEDITRLFRGFPPRNYWVSIADMILAGWVFLAILFGVTRGRHHYQVLRETLYFDDLPDTFDGFTITQLSDIHSGSFSSEKGVEKGIKLVNLQDSDLILFTGDLVNNKATEMDRWIPYFSRLKARYGKYSVLGNHDYGDYVKWDSAEHQAANLARLKEVHKEIGFRLLLNESVKIEKDGKSIALIGVENWGKGGFHKYGDLKKATGGVPGNAFKILMSHDPSHWDAVTVDHHQHIHLTLAGHTHGMQFGIELFGFKWSPVKYVYANWAGLYQQAGKYLYVNRGFGFLGFKGRVGIWPEITVITLKKK